MKITGKMGPNGRDFVSHFHPIFIRNFHFLLWVWPLAYVGRPRAGHPVAGANICRVLYRHGQWPLDPTREGNFMGKKDAHSHSLKRGPPYK